MESFPTKTDTLNAFYFSSRTSPFLAKLLPLLEMSGDSPLVTRSVDKPDGIQVLLSQGAERDSHFAQLCLTLSRKSLALTVATQYNPIEETNQNRRSTLVIEHGEHSLYETNKYNGVYLGRYKGDEAINRFAPVLHRTLEPLGLYSQEQQSRIAS